MNLNYGYDKDAMMELISTADRTLDQHNIAIDFDGEIILDPEKNYPDVSLDKYLFATHIHDQSITESNMIRALYDALEYVYYRLKDESHRTISKNNSLRQAA